MRPWLNTCQPDCFPFRSTYSAQRSSLSLLAYQKKQLPAPQQIQDAVVLPLPPQTLG